MKFYKQVQTYSHKHNLLRPGDRYLLGVSGGVDSMVLLHYFANDETLKKCMSVVHVNHHLRVEADEDAKFVEMMCERYGVPYVAKKVDVPALQRREKIGLEEAARQGRYRCFETAMLETEATTLVLAHHADDQIETILMRLTRGSQGLGYAGIPITRTFAQGRIVRPLLAVTKQAIYEYANANTIEYVEDASNATDAATRNRFRHHVVPLLQQENQQVAQRFSDFHDEQTSLHDFVQQMMLTQFEGIVKKEATRWLLQIDTFRKQHHIMQTMMLRHILQELLPQARSRISQKNIDDALDLLKAEAPSAKLYLPSGLQLIRVYEQAFFQFKALEESERFAVQLQQNDKVLLPNGVAISCKPLGDEVEVSIEKNQLVVNATAIVFPLVVRSRLPGDRMQVKGSGGHRKLKNILIDAKVPQHLRNGIPIVADATGKIIWVPMIKHSATLVDVDKEQQQYLIQYNSL